MKILKALLIIFAVVLVGSIPYCWAFDVSLAPRWNFYTDKSLEVATGAKLQIGHKIFYAFGSCDRPKRELYGQRAGKIPYKGLGGGVRVEIIDGLFCFGELGYFFPSSQMAKDPQSYGEIFYYKVNEWLNTTNFPPAMRDHFLKNYCRYDYEIKGNIGGGAGISFETQIYKGLFLKLSASYQFLKFQETFYARANHPCGKADYLEWRGPINFSSGIVAVNLTYYLPILF